MKFNILILTILALAFVACEDSDPCINGSGQITAYELQVDSFTNIDLSGPMDLRIEQGPVQKVTIEAEPEVYALMTFLVTNDFLEIGFKNNSCFNSNVGVMVHIVVPDLKTVEISGESEITSMGDLDLEELTISSSGVATVELTGEIDNFYYNSSGTLSGSNFDVITSRTWIDISGACSLDVYCTDDLNIEVSGAATIRYKGMPTISQSVSGTLDLIDFN